MQHNTKISLWQISVQSPKTPITIILKIWFTSKTRNALETRLTFLIKGLKDHKWIYTESSLMIYNIYVNTKDA